LILCARGWLWWRLRENDCSTNTHQKWVGKPYLLNCNLLKYYHLS
jgi:hypothetical protein